ncbi:MAG: hypothetical protein WAV38_38640 [Xanthobacteraceae bacterium]
MPRGFVAWLQNWQTLVAALVAVGAAGVAFHNTTRSLRDGKRLEMRRRGRKHAALRAVLPLALSQLTDYAERSAHALGDLLNRCSGGNPPNTAPHSVSSNRHCVPKSDPYRYRHNEPLYSITSSAVASTD